MYHVIKRGLDFILAIISLILLLPLFAIIAIAIKVDSKGPVFFLQKRVGKNKSYFKMIKFRTMQIDTPGDVPTHLLNNPENCITTVGRFLRRSSLDEIPQLLNILSGSMSFVGPRPALWNQYDLVEEREKYGANDVRPGLTGWAQVNGRDELTIEAKARLDGVYAQQISLRFDVKCLFSTIISVLKRKGIVEGKTSELKNEKTDKYEQIVTK